MGRFLRVPMLLVSAQKGGCVSHTVGGGSAAEASPQHAPFELPPGEAITDNIKLLGHQFSDCCEAKVKNSSLIESDSTPQLTQNI